MADTTMTAAELKDAVATVAATLVAKSAVDSSPTSYFAEYDALVAGVGKSLKVPILRSLEANDAEFTELAARTESLVTTAELVMMIVDKAISVAGVFLMAV